MMDQIQTLGAAAPVKTVRKTGAAATGIAILSAQPGTRYKIVGVQMSGDNASGQVTLYHGTNIAAVGKVIASSYIGKGIPFTPPMGDYGDWAGVANEVVQADVITAAYDIVVAYQEIIA